MSGDACSEEAASWLELKLFTFIVSATFARKRTIVVIQNVRIKNGMPIMNRTLNAKAKAVPSSCNPSLQVGHALATVGAIHCTRQMAKTMIPIFASLVIEVCRRRRLLGLDPNDSGSSSIIGPQQ